MPASLTSRRILCACAIAAGVAAGPLARAESNAARAVAWAREHGVPSRQVPITLPGRKATRVFVRVGPEQWERFVSHFSEGKGVIIRQNATDPEHPVLAFSTAETFNHAYSGYAAADRFRDGRAWLSPDQGGLYVALGLPAKQLTYLKNDLSTMKQSDRPFANQSGDGGCMWWLMRALVGRNLPLAHALGVRQSTAPSNLIRKLIHAGTDDVVVGVAVPSLQQTQSVAQTLQSYRGYLATYRANPAYAQYVPQYEALVRQLEHQMRLSRADVEAMTAEELLGVPPGGGAVEAVKRLKL
jgi:hypothetical protein